jgi:ATP-dependent DNA ligase
MAINKHYVGDSDIVFQQAHKLGCEGIVSKRLGSLNRFGRSRHWLKVKKSGSARGTARSGRGLGALTPG